MKPACKKTGKKSKEIIKRDKKFVSQCMTREYSFAIDHTKGCYVWDADGKRYIDFAAGVAVMNVGHSNPDVMKAIAQQTKRAAHVGFADFYADLPVKFIELLVSMLPKHLNQAFLSNSGTEAVEAAYKLSRWHTNRKWTIAFKNAFHGRTMGSLSMTNSQPVQRKRYNPFMPVVHVPYPYTYRFNGTPDDCTNYCLDELEAALKNKDGGVASVFIEPIQGEGGYIVPTAAFMKGVRRLCNQYSVLLCDDDVQAGCYRTGTFLGIENFKIKPDVVSMSKAIGGGIPLGATVASKSLHDWPPGAHSNTFGGNLLACAGGIASLGFMKKKKLGENAKRIGKYMMKQLNEMKEKYEIIGDVRGLGLMIGIEIVKDKRSKKYAPEERQEMLCRAADKGLILLPCGRSTIRMCPPLVITKKQADYGMDIFEDVIKMIETA